MKFGREYNGIIYSVKDDEGKIVSNPFKSSLFGKSYGFEAINKLLEKKAQYFKDKDYLSKPKIVISNTIDNIKSKQGFINQLQENGLDVVFKISTNHQKKNEKYFGILLKLCIFA